MKKISTLLYTCKQGFKNIFRNKLFSLASIATIAACLFLFGLFYSIVTNFQNMVRNVEKGVCVTVFFDEDLEESRIQEIGELISQRTEVSKVVYISEEEAWNSFKQDYLGEYADGFKENPLVGSSNYQIYLNDVSMQESLVTYLESIPGIRKINQSVLLASTLTGANALIGYISVGMIVILLAVSIFLISNTVTIGISVRKEEINIMKYIGATDFFVRAPFVIEGILIGLIGAATPLVTLYLIYEKVVVYVMDRFSMLSSMLSFMPAQTIFHTLTPVSLGMGVGIGFLGSFITVRKHLRV